MVAAEPATLRGLAAQGGLANATTEFVTEEDGPQALARLAGDEDFDVLLLDFHMPGLAGLKGIELARRALGLRPLGVLVPGASLELAKRVLIAGAQGVMPLTIGPEMLAAAVTLLAGGHSFAVVEPAVPLDRLQAAAALSERELQVLHGVSQGLQNKEIAHDFHIQEVTVKMHVRAIIRKLGARNRTHAAMIARDLRIV